MLPRMAHRGPDDEFAVSGRHFSLGVRRLSIIDLNTGRQPVAAEDGKTWAAQNGEIYNYRDLRRTLVSKGHRFATQSDTEVLAHGYEEFGPDLVDRLVGMFAVAVWDDARGRGALMRDRTGKKPLYILPGDDRLYFASELKCLLCVPGFRKSLNPQAVHHYLSLKNVPAPHTVMEGIRMLPPGTLLEVRRGEDGRLTTAERRYWRPDFSTTHPDRSEEEWVDTLHASLKESVRRRLVSDVPIGFFLSGGIDSGLVTAFAAQISPEPIHTFTLVYDPHSTTPGKEADRAAARAIAERFGTIHHEEVLEQQKLEEDLPLILGHFDEPFAGVISTFYLSRLVSRHVKVALAGDGADEVFGSYRSHRLAIPISRYLQGERNPDRLRPFDRQLDELKRLADPDPAVWRSRLLVFTEKEKQALLDPDWLRTHAPEPTESLIAETFRGLDRRDPLNAVLEAEFISQLPDQVMTFVDRLSMAHSLEVRAPFLDHDFLAAAGGIPGSLKIREGEVKYILKKLAERELPREGVWRPKEGFLMPVTDWLMGDLGPFLRRTLTPERMEAHGIFQPAEVTRLVDEFSNGRREHGIKLYTLLAFQVWYDSVFAVQDPPRVIPAARPF